MGAGSRWFESSRPDHVRAVCLKGHRILDEGDAMHVRIYRPAKNAMQSGRSNTKHWVLEFEPSAAAHSDPLMGWTSSPDTRRQVKLNSKRKRKPSLMRARKAIRIPSLKETSARSRRNHMRTTLRIPGSNPGHTSPVPELLCPRSSTG